MYLGDISICYSVFQKPKYKPRHVSLNLIRDHGIPSQTRNAIFQHFADVMCSRVKMYVILFAVSHAKYKRESLKYHVSLSLITCDRYTLHNNSERKEYVPIYISTDPERGS